MTALPFLAAADAFPFRAADGPAGPVQVHVGGRSHRKAAGQGRHLRRLISPHGEAAHARAGMDAVRVATSPMWRHDAGSHRCHVAAGALHAHGRYRWPPLPERIDWWLQVWDASALHALDLLPARIT